MEYFFFQSKNDNSYTIRKAWSTFEYHTNKHGIRNMLFLKMFVVISG
jgi:hypothetical protein